MTRVRLIYPNWLKLDKDDCLAVMLGNVLEDRTHYEHRSELDCEMEGEPLDICERLFRIHNADDRPHGGEIRSMSCGDIIEIDGVEYVCRTVGFERAA
jgi:hypothetical protein